jgi:HEPN domain
VLIRGDLFRVTLPFVMGKLPLICDPTKFTSSHPNNVLNYVSDLQPALANAISAQECAQILTDVKDSLTHLTQIKGRIPGLLKALGLLEQAKSDLAASVEDMLRTPADFGGSRYHSLQAAEKFVKALLSENGIKYPKDARDHDLNCLATLAGSLLTLSSVSIAAANCGAGARYQQPPSTLTEAFEAHRASLLICAAVAKAIGLIPFPLQLE